MGLAGQRPRSVVRVHVDRAAVTGTNQLAPGYDQVNHELFPWAGDTTAVESARTLLRESVAFFNQHIQAWGAGSLWFDPKKSGPDFRDLDSRIQIALDLGLKPMITLMNAPWWMKGRLNADGSTTRLTRADEWAEIAYGSRILDNRMDDWVNLVRQVAERYLAPPWNVRWFQVWNELKGYYNPISNRWDGGTSPGDPSGANAKHGYTFMYNRVYAAVRRAASNIGVNPNAVKVGGPYLVSDTWSTQEAGGFPVTSGPLAGDMGYGYWDDRGLDVMRTWLAEKAGAEFICLGTASLDNCREPINCGDFQGVSKFSDYVSWVRGLDPEKYPGANRLPLVYAEWYAHTWERSTAKRRGAVNAVAMIRCAKAGLAVQLYWGGPESVPPLFTPTTRVGGGQPTPAHEAIRLIHRHFPPGTPLVAVTVDAPNKVEVLASKAATLLVNKTDGPLDVAIDGRRVTLDAHDVAVIS